MGLTSRAALLALAVLISAANSAAQQLSISGTVSDNQGVIPGVVVNLVGPTGAKRNASTDAEGKYSFDGLIAGPYELSFTREGFAPAGKRCQPDRRRNRNIGRRCGRGWKIHGYPNGHS